MAPESHCGNCFSRIGESAAVDMSYVVVFGCSARTVMVVVVLSLFWPTCSQMMHSEMVRSVLREVACLHVSYRKRMHDARYG